MAGQQRGLEPVETAFGHSIGLIDVRKMSAILELFNPVVEDQSRRFLLWCPEDPVIVSPNNVQRLIGKRCPAT